MKLDELLLLLQRKSKREIKNKIIRDNLELFVDSPDSILPYLDLVLFDCSKINSGFLSLIFQNIKPGNQINLNKIIEICLCTFFNYENLISIFRNFCRHTGSFIYFIDLDYMDIINTLNKNNKLCSEFNFVVVGQYLLVFER